MEVKDIKGIGEKIAKTLHEEGIFTVYDLIEHFPKRYRYYRLEPLESLQDGGYHYLCVKVLSKPKIAYINKGMQVISFNGEIEGHTYLFKIYNQRYVMRFIHENIDIVVYGKHHLRRREIVLQTATLKTHFTEGIVPEYGIKGLSDKRFSQFIEKAKSYHKSRADFIPVWLKEKYQLIDLNSLYELVHNPKTTRDLETISRRLKYQELFLYQAKNAYQRTLRIENQGIPKHYLKEVIKKAVEQLPFSLTEAQREVLREIFVDLREPKIMQRVLQGDTGSGKTIVAFLAMLAVMSSGYQVAFMAPTEILAHQHKRVWDELFADFGYNVSFLTGNVSSLERKTLSHQLREHKIHGIIGTHALFSHDIHYDALGLVITDEQHRFGVNQRAILKNKGILPDVLYLSATPIPRTFAMTLFGDMDISIIKDKPIGRKAVKTQVISSKERTIVRQKMKDTLTKQGQIFVVAPTIEETEQGLIGVKTVYEVIKERYPNANVGLLHAKLKNEKKHQTLQAFYQGKIDILVSTTVIEVGIDVSNASLMIIYRAERFGYAQLHQLRGRVGRGTKVSECILIFEGNQETEERLKVLETIHDGFTLSEYDLRIRGFGDLLGVMQSGILRFNYADIEADLELFKQAKEDATKVLNDDQTKTSLVKHLKKVIEQEQVAKL